MALGMFIFPWYPISWIWNLYRLAYHPNPVAQRTFDVLGGVQYLVM